MTQAKDGNSVKVHYTGKLDDGLQFDTSMDGDPLEFTVGQGQIIPGFEEAVVGMQLGESKTIKIPSDQAYGPRQEEMVLQVGKENFPPDIDLAVGQQLQMTQANDQAIIVMVTDIADDHVTLDANHPLAGEDLTFDIELVAID